MRLTIALQLCLTCLIVFDVSGQEPTTYTTAQGVVVNLPLGDLSFADRAVRFDIGDPRPDSTFLDAMQLTGPPDYEYVTDETYVTLGCGGSVTVEFTDNVLIDGPGPDLHVFEIGPDVEGLLVDLSTDGKEWISIGEISGGKSWVDISTADSSGKRFPYVRLTDLQTACASDWPGADIDAVAATSTAMKLSLQSNLLFEFDRYELRDSAMVVIEEIVARIAGLDALEILVEGHTDSVGTSAYNTDLSNRRAREVSEMLKSMLDDKEISVKIAGLGEAFPIASNSTASGRERNRRVDIYVSRMVDR